VLESKLLFGEEGRKGIGRGKREKKRKIERF
jgi:hypothetical protein